MASASAGAVAPPLSEVTKEVPRSQGAMKRTPTSSSRTKAPEREDPASAWAEALVQEGGTRAGTAKVHRKPEGARPQKGRGHNGSHAAERDDMGTERCETSGAEPRTERREME